jgi:hypothetical protein
LEQNVSTMCPLLAWPKIDTVHNLRTLSFTNTDVAECSLHSLNLELEKANNLIYISFAKMKVELRRNNKNQQHGELFLN